MEARIAGPMEFCTYCFLEPSLSPHYVIRFLQFEISRAGGYVYDLMIIHLKDMSCNLCSLDRLSLDCSVNNWLPAVECTSEGGISFTGYRAALGSTTSPLQWVLGSFPPGLSVRYVKLTSQLRVPPMLKMYRCTWLAFFIHNTHFQNRLVFSDYSEDRDSMSVRNLGAYMPMYTASYSRRLEFPSPLPSQPRISHELRCSEYNRSPIKYLFFVLHKITTQ